MKKKIVINNVPITRALKVSQVVAKSIVRIFVLMLMAAAASYFLAPAATEGQNAQYLFRGT